MVLLIFSCICNVRLDPRDGHSTSSFLLGQDSTSSCGFGQHQQHDDENQPTEEEQPC